MAPYRGAVSPAWRFMISSEPCTVVRSVEISEMMGTSAHLTYTRGLVHEAPTGSLPLGSAAYLRRPMDAQLRSKQQQGFSTIL